MAVVGLERTFYLVSEETHELELCVNVHSPSIECPIEISFNISIFTSDNTAGNSNRVLVQRNCVYYAARKNILFMTLTPHGSHFHFDIFFLYNGTVFFLSEDVNV